MTIINPKSIAGVTSITTPSGSDNLFTVHTNNTTERVRINNDGDVIVGSGITVSPDGDIFATGVCTATTFSGSGASLTNLNASNIASGTVPTARLGSGTASSSTFLRGDSTFAAVTSTTINSNTNNYLITGTGTADTLQGEANLQFNGNELSIADTNPQFKLTDTTNNTDAYLFSDDNGSIRLAADLNSEASDSRIRMSTDGTERVSIAEHLTISDGNLVIGTSGHGIDFSATGDSSGTTTNEVFDDYEEGTFTPTSNATISGQYGVYTKIGRQVTIHIRLVVGSQTNGTAFAITGLPYNANMLSGLSNGSQPGGFGYISGSPFSGGGAGGNGEPQIHMRYNNNYVEFYNFGSALSITTWSGREIRLGFIYYVD